MKRTEQITESSKLKGSANYEWLGLPEIRLSAIDISEQIKELISIFLDPQYDISGSDPETMLRDAQLYGKYLFLLKQLRKEGKKYSFSVEKSDEFTNKEIRDGINDFLKTGTFNLLERYIYGNIQFTEPPKQKVKTFRKNGHLTDMLLRGIDKNDDTPELFPKDLSLKGSSSDVIFDWNDLTASEHQIITCISKLLDEKSQTKNPLALDYYTGNTDIDAEALYGKDEYGKPVLQVSPTLSITLFELSKEFYGIPNPSGKHQDNTRDIINRLAEKKFRIRYQEQYKVNKGKTNQTKIIRIEEDLPLIRKITYTETDINDGVISSETNDLILVLNPLFRAQIATKFYIVPSDILKRTRDANGGGKISLVLLQLLEYLLREFDSKRYNPTHGLEGLLEKIAASYMKANKKALAKDWFEKSAETCKKVGILSDYRFESASNGKLKVMFTLNKEWK